MKIHKVLLLLLLCILLSGFSGCAKKEAVEEESTEQEITAPEVIDIKEVVSGFEKAKLTEADIAVIKSRMIGKWVTGMKHIYYNEQFGTCYSWTQPSAYTIYNYEKYLGVLNGRYFYQSSNVIIVEHDNEYMFASLAVDNPDPAGDGQGPYVAIGLYASAADQGEIKFGEIRYPQKVIIIDKATSMMRLESNADKKYMFFREPEQKFLTELARLEKQTFTSNVHVPQLTGLTISGDFWVSWQNKRDESKGAISVRSPPPCAEKA